MKKFIVLLLLFIVNFVSSAFGFDFTKKIAVTGNSGFIIPIMERKLEGIDLINFYEDNNGDLIEKSMIFGGKVLYGYKKNYAIEFNFSYSPLNGKSLEQGKSNWEDKAEVDLSLMEITTGIRYLIFENKWGVPYISGGIGFYRISGKVIESSIFNDDLTSDSQDTSSTDILGINGGGGFMHFFKNSTALDIQGRLHVTSNITYLSINGGIIFFFK